MGSISVSLPADDSTADVADYNTPITTIVNAINGGLDNANIISGAAIDPSKIAGGSASMLSAWQSYTPTFSNLTIGNGTLVAKYNQIGKNISVRVSIVFGSGSSISGGVSFGLPVTAATYAGSGGLTLLGSGLLYDQSAARPYGCTIGMLTTTTGEIRTLAADQPYLYSFPLSSTVPMTWTSLDEISFSFSYEAA